MLIFVHSDALDQISRRQKSAAQCLHFVITSTLAWIRDLPKGLGRNSLVHFDYVSTRPSESCFDYKYCVITNQYAFNCQLFDDLSTPEHPESSTRRYVFLEGTPKCIVNFRFVFFRYTLHQVP